jgi:anhydro-N-acetylmuramic acid kinase
MKRADLTRPLRPMTVAGIMSGTSADGIDVALVRIQPPRNADPQEWPRPRLLSHTAVPYSRAVRERVLRAMNGRNESVAELSQLNWRLGQLYAGAVAAALQQHPARLDLIGCHGQTLYHQTAAHRFLGAPVRCTWQAGEPSILAQRFGVPVAFDFRPADLAAGGEGAPLVPLLDYVMFRHPERARVLQNLGGIGNLTVIPAGAEAQEIVAFDTGPGNMVIDALMTTCFHRRYDAQGAIAARGRIVQPVLQRILEQPFFRVKPPKSAGREQFGREFAARFLRDCRARKASNADAVATATALTAASIGLAAERFVHPLTGAQPVDWIVSGGGAKNPTLLRMIREALPQAARVRTSDASGLPSEAKEAVAFALLAYCTWHGLPGNLPSATGARHPVILGRIAYA